MGKDERKRHQKEWKERVGYNSRWMVEIINPRSSGCWARRSPAVKPEYIMMEWTTKISGYNKTRDIMDKTVW